MSLLVMILPNVLRMGINPPAHTSGIPSPEDISHDLLTTLFTAFQNEVVFSFHDPGGQPGPCYSHLI